MKSKKTKPSDILAAPDASRYQLAVDQLEQKFKSCLRELKKKNVQTYQIVNFMAMTSDCFAVVVNQHLAHVDKFNTYKDNCRRMDEAGTFLGLTKNGNN